MANSHDPLHARSPQRRGTPRRTTWMSERQLDAYFQARETLRRASDFARSGAQPPDPSAPPSSL